MWYIVYAKKVTDPYLKSDLEEKKVEYYIPTQVVKNSADNSQAPPKVEYPLGKLIFVKTPGRIQNLILAVDGLLCIYKDHATDSCAVVPDAVMEAFRTFLTHNDEKVLFLKDPFSHFWDKKKVRVTAGPFQGMEGRVVRVQRKRKLVLELGTFAVAISGFDPSQLEPLD